MLGSNFKRMCCCTSTNFSLQLIEVNLPNGLFSLIFDVSNKTEDERRSDIVPTLCVIHTLLLVYAGKY